ncbi:MAG TPA: hypothetical protein VIV40_36445 [Kofleriaceae bacterium]
MTERERLARVFGIEPMRPAGAIVIAAALGAMPLMWIASCVLVVSLAAIYADEQRKIREGLDEVHAWGFVVEGYRQWLLAREPAFDLELRSDVALQLIEGSCAAVDTAIEVERRGERVVRVLMRRVEVRGSERSGSFLAGDRKRLSEVHDRVLAPLHADVGIVAMRMGERESLGALVGVAPATPAVASAFRDQAKAAPPDLQSLIHTGTSQLVPPHEAAALGLRTERVLFATGQTPTTAGLMALPIAGLMIAGWVVAPIGGLLGAGAGALVSFVMRRHDRSVAARALSHAQRWPFFVDGYEDWLLSGRPIFDIEFGSPPNRAEVERRLRQLARVAELTWLSDVVIRVESQPILHHAEQGLLPFWGGDPRELQQIARLMLVPLHEAHRVVAVRMGGYLDRRV